jgi:hypothetical protein
MSDVHNSAFDDLIPELTDWNNGQRVNILTWLHAVGDYKQAIAYGELYWPTFVEHDGCVFRASIDDEVYRTFLEQTGGDKSSTEMVINHIHIIDLFASSDSTPTLNQALHLGRLIKAMWAAKLIVDYPGRAMIVSFSEDDFDSLLDLEVTFFQKR